MGKPVIIFCENTDGAEFHQILTEQIDLMRIAVIDLGTNTCNLLIAKVEKKDYEVLHQSKELVKLGDGKIKQNEISHEGIGRVLAAMGKHRKIIQKFGVSSIRVIATSAVRSATNKADLLQAIKNLTGWKIEIISGEEEADLIFQGVLLAFNRLDKPSLILDIGGGSNEIILNKREQLQWKESRPTGMGRVINIFKISDPIKPGEIATLANYFREEHQNAILKATENKVKTLIGCSGAFDTIADIIDKVQPNQKQRKTQQILLDDFYEVYHRLLKSRRKERAAMKGMDMVRVDLIIPGIIFIEMLIREVGISQIVQTGYALREGVLARTIERNTFRPGSMNRQ